MLCLFKKLLVFVLTHLLLTPFYYVPHRLTSLFTKNNKQHEKGLSCLIFVSYLFYYYSLLSVACCFLYSLAWSIKASS